MNFDLIIRGGKLVHADRVETADLAIQNGKIAATLKLGEAAQAKAELSAAGKLVLPGFVDAHVHLREPGITHKEDFGSGTRAAAAGGVTTVMVMPTDNPWTATPEQFAEKRALAEGKAHVDFMLQAAIGPKTCEIEKLAAAGAVSFEIFLAGGIPDFMVEDDDLFRSMLQRIAACNSVAGITAGSPRLYVQFMEEAKAMGPPSTRSFAAARPPIAEAVGFARACLMAREAGARIHFRQTSCGESVDILDKLGVKDQISAEVVPHNLALTDKDSERLGCFGTVIPPLRPEAENARLREALKRGTIDIVATDHAPHLVSEKEKGRENVWLAPSGFAGVQTFPLVMLGLAQDGALSFPDVVRTCAERPARLFGIYPRKGHLAPGADADIIVVDPDATTEIRNQDQLSRAAFTPFAGKKVKARILEVLLRGEAVAKEGAVSGPARGRFVAPGAA